MRLNREGNGVVLMVAWLALLAAGSAGFGQVLDGQADPPQSLCR
jgi:hypothetical protein